MRIYVGNLTYRSSERDVHKAFESYGQVTMCRLAIDPQTGRSAGFAYVEMPNEDEAQNAIARLNGKEINSRVVSVSQATVEQAPAPPERTSRPGRSSRPEGTYRDASDSRRHTTRQPRGEQPRGEQSRGEKSRSEQPPRSDERPVVDNPWTRRRPPQGK